MFKSSKSLDWRGFDCCSFSCLSVAVANEDELYWISHQNYFDRDQMWACGCICRISWNTLHRGYSHFLLTVGGQMIPGLVLDPVGIRLTHCNFELILFVGGVVYWSRASVQHILYLALGIPETCSGTLWVSVLFPCLA